MSSSWDREYPEFPPEDPPSKEELKALDEYARAVDEVIQAGLSTEIANGSPRHARIILERMFRVAVGDVIVYSGHLRRVARDPETNKLSLVWAHAPLVEAAVEFLRKPNTRLTMLVQNYVDGSPAHSGTDHPFLKSILADESRKGTVEIAIARSDKSGVLASSKKHFAVADDRVYRLETRGNGLWAIASFNGPTFAGFLRSGFERTLRRVLSSSSPIIKPFHMVAAAPLRVALQPEYLGQPS